MSNVQVGDKVRVVRCSSSVWWYNYMIGQEFTVTDLRVLGDGLNYRTDDGSILATDAELVVTGVASLTLSQVATTLARADAAIASAQALLDTAVRARETLVGEIAALGLSVLAGEHSVSVAAPQETLQELYDGHRRSVQEGDRFRWTGETGRAWTNGDVYVVLTVDTDDSVRMTTDAGGDYEDGTWAWGNEDGDDLRKFVKAA